MKILLVEGDRDKAALIREALLEIDEIRRWRSWVHNIHLVHIERLEDATAVLAEEQFDAALADIALPDAYGLEVFLSLSAQAPEMPVILLVSDDEDTFAASAVREGAADCLPLSELDCALLARALRKAVERHRRTQALRSAALLDIETGLFNRQGFLAVADRDCRLARRLNRSVSLVVAALDHARDETETGRHTVEILATALRLSFGETDLIARLDSSHFAVLSLCGEAGVVSASIAALLRDRVSVRVGAATLGPKGEWSSNDLLNLAQSSLCEEGLNESGAQHPARRATA